MGVKVLELVCGSQCVGVSVIYCVRVNLWE